MNVLRQWRSVLHRLGLAVGAALFLWQAWSAGQALVTQQIRLVRPELIGVGVVAVLIATIFQVGAWRLAMQDLGTRLNWRDSLRGYMLPFVARYIPGMVWGYLSRTHWLQTRHGTPPQQSNLGAVVEILGLILSAAVMIIIGGALAQSAFFVGLGASGAAVSIVGLVLGPTLLMWGLRQSGRRLPWDVDAWLGAVTLRRIGRAALWQLGLWLFDGAMVWACLGGLGVATTVGGAASLGFAVAAFALAWLVGFLAFFLPAGLGLRELSLAYLLTSQMGLRPDEAAAAAILARASIVASELFYVALGLLLTPRHSGHNADEHKATQLADPEPDQT